MAKTDWQMDDIVKPEDMNQIGQEINENKNDIGDMSTVPTQSKNAAGAITELFTSVSDGKSKVATAVTDKGVPTLGSDTFEQIADNIRAIETDPSGDATAVAGDILSGKTAYSQGQKITGTMPNHGAKTYTPTDAVQSGGAGYYSGITVNPRPALSGDATAAQVLSGRTFYGSNYTKQSGTMPNQGNVANTITTQGGSYTIPAGYHAGAGKVTAQFANLVASNVRQGVNIGGVVGNLVQGATIKSQQKITATIPQGSNTVDVNIGTVNHANSIAILVDGERRFHSGLWGFWSDLRGSAGITFLSNTTVRINLTPDRTRNDSFYVSFYIIEFEGIKTIKKGAQALSGRTVITLPAPAINPNKSMLFMTGYGSSNSYRIPPISHYTLTDSELEIWRSGSDGTLYLNFSIVEFY